MLSGRKDWIRGEPTVQYLCCEACGSSFHLSVAVCPRCGGELHVATSSLRGECVATTFVPARYSISGQEDWFCLICMVEGFRVLMRAGSGVVVGQCVEVMFETSLEGLLVPTAVAVDGSGCYIG